MNNIHKILSKYYIIKIKEYKDIYRLLDPLVKKYWETYLEEWKHFGSWDFSEDGEYVVVDYNYLNYNDEWEWDSENIPIEKIVEIINT